jgi:hypothetical protein
MASAINPNFLQGGADYPASCEPSGVASNWWYNQSIPCGGGGPFWAVQFPNWVWEHEDQHAATAKHFVNAISRHNLPAVLEELVRGNVSALHQRVAEITEETGNCVTWAAATHVGFPTPAFNISSWDGTEWNTWVAGSLPWWPTHPVPSDCL